MRVARRESPVTDRLDEIRRALEEQYHVVRQLGRGAMAGVYLAERVTDYEPVAVKVLHPEFAVSVVGQRFHREIGFLQQLEHPSILPLLTSDQLGGFLFYVMPFAAGGSLSGRLSQESRLPLGDAIAIVREMAEALDYAHLQNVVHRDIKPGNILFYEGRPVLCDFGVARAIVQAGGEHISSTGLIIGTPTYMSPEQAAGKRELDGRSDVYSLACVVYEMLLGEPPFTGRSAQSIMAKHIRERPPSLRVVRPELPERVEQAVHRGLAKEAAARPQRAGEFSRALEGD
jgi:serine/threonine-protein kinase